jgi:hypothetical protein
VKGVVADWKRKVFDFVIFFMKPFCYITGDVIGQAGFLGGKCQKIDWPQTHTAYISPSAFARDTENMEGPYLSQSSKTGARGKDLIAGEGI